MEATDTVHRAHEPFIFLDMVLTFLSDSIISVVSNSPDCCLGLENQCMNDDDHTNKCVLETEETRCGSCGCVVVADGSQGIISNKKTAHQLGTLGK